MKTDTKGENFLVIEFCKFDKIYQPIYPRHFTDPKQDKKGFRRLKIKGKMFKEIREIAIYNNNNKNEF